MSQSSKPIPLAVPNELLTHIDAVAYHMCKSRSEIMRLAIEIGLADLKAINYDIANTISNAAHRRDLALVAEDPTPYGATGKQNRAG